MAKTTTKPSSPQEFTRHPLSALFAQFDLDTAGLTALVDDLKTNGLLNPITTHEGMILDGWNRFQACTKAKVRPLFASLPPGLDPWKFVWAMNGQRRHMTASDLMSIYLKHQEMMCSEAPAGGGTKLSPPSPSIQAIQDETGVSRGTAMKAAKIARANDPALTEALASGQVSLAEAADLAKLTEPERKEALDHPEPKPLKAKAPTGCPACAELRSELDELISSSAAEAEEFAAMVRIVDADDQMAQLRAELKRYMGAAQTEKAAKDGFMAQVHFITKTAAGWKRKLEALERKFKALDRDETFQTGA